MIWGGLFVWQNGWKTGRLFFSHLFIFYVLCGEVTPVRAGHSLNRLLFSVADAYDFADKRPCEWFAGFSDFFCLFSCWRRAQWVVC